MSVTFDVTDRVMPGVPYLTRRASMFAVVFGDKSEDLGTLDKASFFVDDKRPDGAKKAKIEVITEATSMMSERQRRINQR